MKQSIVSIRPFIGARDYALSREFYRYIGFGETVLSPDMSLFTAGAIGFYLQRYYSKEWIENLMVFAEVEDADRYWTELSALDVAQKFPGARLSPVRTFDWGKECYLHDPSGILWHFGQFSHR